MYNIIQYEILHVINEVVNEVKYVIKNVINEVKDAESIALILLRKKKKILES